MVYKETLLGLLFVLTVGLILDVKAQWVPNTTEISFTGTVAQFKPAPDGKIDGLFLTDGTEVHFPPSYYQQVAAVAKPGAEVKIAGWQYIGPAGDRHIYATSITGQGGTVEISYQTQPTGVLTQPGPVSPPSGNQPAPANQPVFGPPVVPSSPPQAVGAPPQPPTPAPSAAVPLPPPSPGFGPPAPPTPPAPVPPVPAITGQWATITGKVIRCLYTPMGELEWLILDSSVAVHIPPHLSYLAQYIQTGAHVQVSGWLSSPYGQQTVEAYSITPLATAG